MTLKGRVALVTGGSRGAGRGIAIELAIAGAMVYITGRSQEKATTEYQENTLDITIKMIRAEGGQAEALFCDHNVKEDMDQVVNYIVSRHERIDILVNNVWAGYTNQENELKIPDFTEKFWNQPLWRWDKMFTTSLRAHFYMSKLVAPKMVAQKQGLIITTGFWDDDKYLSNLPYDVVKQAKHRLMYGMAIELEEHNVAAISLGLGWIRTEHIHHLYGVDDQNYKDNKELEKTESTRYAGKAVVSLAQDPDVMRFSGQILVTGEVAHEYGFNDIDGSQPDRFHIPEPEHNIRRRR